MKKALFLVFALVFSSCYANSVSSRQSESLLVNNNTPQTFRNRDVNGKNANLVEVASLQPASAEDSAKINAIKQKEREEEDKIPVAFNRVDFKNFTYPVNWLKKFVRLKDGSYEYEHPKHMGGEIFDFVDANYIKLTNDQEKKAIIRLNRVSCGGSCDGGSSLFYVYSIEKNEPKLLWKFETGSLAYGGGLRSLTVKNSKIIVEEFGENVLQMNKFHVKDTIRFVFAYKGGKFIQESEEAFSVPERDVKNYQPEINIENE